MDLAFVNYGSDNVSIVINISPPLLTSPVNHATGQPPLLNLVWNKSLDVSKYRVQVALDSLFNIIVINDSTLTDTTKSISGLSPLTNYWWRVASRNSENQQSLYFAGVEIQDTGNSDTDNTT